MSVLSALLIGFIVGVIFCGGLAAKSEDKQLKSGHIHDSEYNWYRVEKEER